MPQTSRVMQLIRVFEGEDRCMDAFAFGRLGEEVNAVIVEFYKIGEEMVIPWIISSDILQGTFNNWFKFLLQEFSTEDIPSLGVYVSKALMDFRYRWIEVIELH